MYRQSLVWNVVSLSGSEFRRTLPPTFLFLQYSVFKEQTPQTRCLGPFSFWLRARSSVAHAALLISSRRQFQKRTSSSPAARRPRCGAYIVGALFGCQHRFPSFLNFLRRPCAAPFGRCVTSLGGRTRGPPNASPRRRLLSDIRESAAFPGLPAAIRGLPDPCSGRTKMAPGRGPYIVRARVCATIKPYCRPIRVRCLDTHKGSVVLRRQAGGRARRGRGLFPTLPASFDFARDDRQMSW